MKSRTYKKSRLCRRHRGGTTKKVNFEFNPAKYSSAGILNSGCTGTQSGMAAAAAKYVPYSPSSTLSNAAQLGGRSGPSAPVGQGALLSDSYGRPALRTANHNRHMHKHTSLNVASAKTITGGSRHRRSRRHRNKSKSGRYNRRRMAGGDGQPYSNIPYTPGYSLGGLSLSPNESALANGYMKPYNNCATIKRN